MFWKHCHGGYMSLRRSMGRLVQVACLACLLALATCSSAVHGLKLANFGLGSASAFSGAVADPFSPFASLSEDSSSSSSSSSSISSSSSSSLQKTQYGCPKDPIFDDPWVKQNIAVTYGLKIRDGLGSQTARMMGVYAVAAAAGIQYSHSPFECIGHIGGVPHWRNMRCDHLPPADLHKLKRISANIQLPSTTTANTSAWESHYIFRGDWAKLASIAAGAKAAQRPTLIKLELVDEFISVCPDIFYHVPAWRPKFAPSSRVTANTSSPAQPWLLSRSKSCRIVVHMRRGDVTTASAKREMPASYYVNVVKNLIQVLESMQQDYSVEWFTEPSSNSKEHEDMMMVRREVPNLTLLFDSDLLWTWQQMWTSDIFVMSKSGYSFVPAIVNSDAIIIHAPASGIKKCKIACSPSHWFDAQDEAGHITEEIVDEVRRRAGSAFARAG